MNLIDFLKLPTRRCSQWHQKKKNEWRRHPTERTDADVENTVQNIMPSAKSFVYCVVCCSMYVCKTWCLTIVVRHIRTSMERRTRSRQGMNPSSMQSTLNLFRHQRCHNFTQSAILSLFQSLFQQGGRRRPLARPQTQQEQVTRSKRGLVRWQRHFTQTMLDPSVSKSIQCFYVCGRAISLCVKRI